MRIPGNCDLAATALPTAEPGAVPIYSDKIGTPPSCCTRRPFVPPVAGIALVGAVCVRPSVRTELPRKQRYLAIVWFAVGLTCFGRLLRV